MNVILILCDTLRRDHIGAYNFGRPLDELGNPQAPSWRVPTPNLDRLADRSVVFENCWCGSTPCMPARRDVYTGRLEFLERGWGPLEEFDADLPRQVSGQPNRSMQDVVESGDRVSYMVSDHFHLWEQGSGNYHMGYTGFDFVRGCEADALYTAPLRGFEGDRTYAHTKLERHARNVHYLRQGGGDYFCSRVCRKAADWLDRNAGEYEDFYLHLDIFDPHEPWDPPEALLRQFDPAAATVEGAMYSPAYAPWRENYSEKQFHNFRARYAAKVAFLDQQLGRVFEAMDRNDLWSNTMVILTADHGTFNGDHDRLGKLQTHQFDSCAHIPLVIHHPDVPGGQRRQQLAQLVDLYPTVLSAVGKSLPEMPDERPLHGVDLGPAIADAAAPTRDYALAGMFGMSVTCTDGRWVLHQAPVAENQPLYWYGYHLSRFFPFVELGEFDGRRRSCRNPDWGSETWLSDRRDDPTELKNLAGERPEELQRMQQALRGHLEALKAPAEQLQRLGLK